MGTGVTLGLGTGSVWAGVITPVALLGALLGLVQLDEGSTARFWALSLGSAALLGVAMWLSGGRGAWWLAVVWGVVALIQISAAVANSFSRPYRAAIAFGLFCLAVCAAWPFAAGASELPDMSWVRTYGPQALLGAGLFGGGWLVAWLWVRWRRSHAEAGFDAHWEPSPSPEAAYVTSAPAEPEPAAVFDPSILFGSSQPPEIPDLSALDDQRPLRPERHAAPPAPVEPAAREQATGAPAVVTVAEPGSPVVSAVPLIGGGLAVLAEDGGLSRWQGGVLSASGQVPVKEPLGLVATAEGRVVLVEGAGRMVELEFTEDGVANTHAAVTGSARCFAGKPFGAIVAYAGDAPGVFGFVVAEDKLRFLAGEIEDVRALAYSADGSRLACATADGQVIVLDLRAEERRTLDDAGGTVSLLASSPRGWVAVVGEKRVVMWGEGGAVGGAWTLEGSAVALAVDTHGGDVAVGGRRGQVRVRSADLSQDRYDVQAIDGAIASLAFVDGGGLLVAGKNRRVVEVRP